MSKIIWGVWLLLLIIWNFGVPNALPYEDVLVSICISYLANYMENKYV
jgi:hypothetical protein|tara:strand:- start:438 stop:581 length:144 start_codon:yes stop_codon:yes gene_type:complete